MGEISAEEARNIVGFLGYGNLAAKLWFVGLEEGLSAMSDSDVAHNLKARGRWESTMDLKQAHLSLIEHGSPYDLDRRTAFTPVWTWIARFSRALLGAVDWQDFNQAKRYVREQLGRSDGQIFMTYAAPVPEKKLEDRRWTEGVRQSGIPFETACQQRNAMLRKYFTANEPKTVICHGKAATGTFKSTFPVKQWTNPPHLPSVSIGTAENGTCCLITPFFGNGQMSGHLAQQIVELLEAISQGRFHDTDAVDCPSEARSTYTSTNRAAPEVGNFVPDSRSDRFRAETLDPALTVELLNYLRGQRFTDGAFSRLHHNQERGKRETINGFTNYCGGIRSFRSGDSNEKIHLRLLYVLERRAENPESSFDSLASAAYKAIPPNR